MAFTRAFLKGLGIEKEQIDEIMEAHAEVTEALKAQRDEYKKDSEKLASVQKELDILKATEETESSKYKSKYEKAIKDLDDYKNEVSTKETKSKKEAEARKILKDSNIPEKYFDKIIKYSAEDIDSFEFDDDGNVTKTDSFKKSIESDWSDYKTEDKKKGTDTSTPPTGSKGKTYASKEEIMKIKDSVERQQAISDNHELFGL